MIKANVAKLLVAVIAASISGKGASAQATTPEAARAWGLGRSDLAPHPGVRFGVLPNGMRYALMRSAAPAGALAVRMRVGAGAAVESGRQRGFMHVLEHLVFQGSAHLPPTALPLMLRQQGLRRPDDFSAVTGFDETVYRLDLPRADARARETALTVMREVASHLSFARKLVERARQSVRDELAGQDASRERLIAAQDAFFVPGTAAARGPVGGSAESVVHAGGAALRRLYELYYTPAKATLVMVGDFDPDTAEREIAARFADWRAGETATATAGPPPPSLVRADGGTRTRFFVDAQAETSVTIATVEPPGGVDASGRRDAAFLAHLGAEMLSARLARLARSKAGGDAPVSGGSASVYDYFSAARIARVDIAARGRDWKRALATGATELAHALAGGFSQAELDAQLAAARAALARGTGVATSSAAADAIVDAINRGLVFTNPGDPAAALVYLASVRLDAVNAAFRGAWSNPGRLIFVAHNARITDAEAATATEWTRSLQHARDARRVAVPVKTK